jgi:hypothetical protein
MLRSLMFLTVLSCAVPGIARAWTCESAHNLAANSARLYVSQVFGKVQRGEATVERAHSALLFVLASQTLRPTESRENKLCYDQGLWEGLTSQLAIEYQVAGLACLERPVLAAYAGAVLHAVSIALAPDDAFGPEDAQAVFIEPAVAIGVPWCDGQPLEECAQHVREQAGAQALARYGELVDGLAGALCVLPPESEPSADAGTDAGAAQDAGASEGGLDGGN